MVRKRYRKTMFNHLILSYTVLSIALIGAMGGYWYSQTNKMMDQEIAKDNLTRLKSVRTFIEQTLLKKYEDNLQNKGLAIRLIQNNSHLNSLMYNGWENNLSGVSAFRNDLEFFMLENAGVTNVSVYFPENNYLIDAERFYMSMDNSEEAAFLSRVTEYPMKKWIPRVNPEGTEVLTYIIKLPYGMPEVKTKGYYMIDVGTAYLQQSVAPMLNSRDDYLVLADELDRPFLTVGTANEQISAHIQTAVGLHNAEEKRIEEAGVPGIISQLAPDLSGHNWTYAMYRPTHSLELFSGHFKNGLYTVSGIIVLFGLLMSFLLSKGLYVPVKRLMNRIGTFQLAQAGSTQRNEYVIIDDALSLMNDKIVDLKQQAAKSGWISLLLGVNPDEEQQQLLRPDRVYRVAYLNLECGDTEDLQRHYEFNASLPGEFVALNAKEAAVIYEMEPDDDEEEPKWSDELKALQRMAGSEIIFRASLGRVAMTREEIAESYQTALQAGRYHFLYGRSAVVSYSATRALRAEPLFFPFEHFGNALKAGDAKGAGDFLHHFQAELLQDDVQIEVAELAVLQAISCLYQCVIEMELQHVLPHANLFDELKKDTLSETVESIRYLSVQITERMNTEGNSARDEVIRTLKAYIAKHLNEDLSLQILAKEVSLAPAYISTLFNEGTKSSFAEYITKLRMEKAAELLVAEPRLSVAEIAERTGYRSVQYFHSKFKARYGVTPVQYRKSHRDQGDWITLEE